MLVCMPADHDQTVGLAGASTLLDGYAPLPRTYDQLFRGDGTPRDEVADLVSELGQFGRAEFITRQRLAEGALFPGRSSPSPSIPIRAGKRRSSPSISSRG